jgi:hypothetical protein
MKSTVSTARPVCSANTMSSRDIWLFVFSMIAERTTSNCCAVAPMMNTTTTTASTCKGLLTEGKRLRRSGASSLMAGARR